MANKYKIENISEDQMKILSQALEFYSRFLFGQVEYIPMELDFKKDVNNEEKNKKLKELKKILFPELELNEYYGVGNYLKEGKNNNFKLNGQISYEIFKDIKKYIHTNNSNKDDFFSVDSLEPLRYSGEEKINISPFIRKPLNKTPLKNNNNGFPF